MKSQETPEWVLRRASPGCQGDREDWPRSWGADAQKSLPEVSLQAERGWWPIWVHIVRIGWEDAHRNWQQSERGTELTQRTELDFFRPVLYRLGEWERDPSFLLRHQTTCLKPPSKRQTWVLREERLDGKWMIESPGWALGSPFPLGLRRYQWLRWGRSPRCLLCWTLAGYLMAKAQNERGIRTLRQAYLIEQVFFENNLCFWGCYTSYGLSQHPPLLRKQTLSSKLSFLRA